MSVMIDPGLMTGLHRYGKMDVNACFSCGNCTAICPLSDNDVAFPRSVIRLAQVGLEQDLVSSKELWTCYQCGRCTDRCPQEADPSAFMATARRYAIAHYDKTRIAKTLYTRPVLGGVIVLAFALAFAAFFVSVKEQESRESLALFGFIPYPIIHTAGLVLIVVVAVLALVSLGLLARDMARNEGVTARSLFGGRAAWGRTVRAAWYALGVEAAGQTRYRKDCADDQPAEPLYRRRWLIHMLTLWGFLGLLAATIINYGLDVLGIKPTGTMVPLWYPVRLLGTVAGLALMYGVTFFMLRRRRESKQGKPSAPTDWLFLWMLWLVGLSGFLIEVALYIQPVQVWGYWVFLVHVALAMELVLFLPFTKFAHAMYRPLALFFYGLARDKART